MKKADFYKVFRRPYYLRKASGGLLTNLYTSFYGKFFLAIEVISVYIYLNIVTIFAKKKRSYSDNNKALICRTNLLGDTNFPSEEKYQVDDTFQTTSIDFETFFWDDDRRLFFNQIDFVRKVLNQKPNIIILSSYHLSHFTHPRIFILKKLKKLFDINLVALWWDSCANGFSNDIKKYINPIDLHVLADNPKMDIDLDFKTIPKRKFIGLFAPHNPNEFPNNKNKTIDASFIGQIDSYRSYRRDYILHLMKNNIPGFYSTLPRGSQLDHKEYCEVMSKSKYVINLSKSTSKSQFKGRIIEAMISGALLFEQKNSQMDCFFIEGHHYISFTSKEDLVDKINYFQDNEEKRLEIAMNGRDKVTNELNGKVFWEKILERLEVVDVKK